MKLLGLWLAGVAAGTLFVGSDALALPPAVGPVMVQQSQIGAPGGVAALGSNGQVPIAQLPVGTGASQVAAGNDSRIGGALQKSVLPNSPLIGSDGTGNITAVTPDSTLHISGGTIGLPAANGSGAGSYGNVTVDAQGRVTTIRAPVPSDITGFSAAAATAAPVQSVGGNAGTVTNAQVLGSVTSALGYTPPPIGLLAGQARDAALAISAESSASSAAAAAAATANAALPVAGGAMTGVLNMQGHSLINTAFTGSNPNGGPIGTTAVTLNTLLGSRPDIGMWGGSVSGANPAQIAWASACTTAGGGVLYLPQAGSTGWSKSWSNTPAGCGYEVDAKSDPELTIGLSYHMPTSLKAFEGVSPGGWGGGSIIQQTMIDMGALVVGSGNGLNEDSILNLRQEKQNYLNTLGTGTAPNLGGMIPFTMEVKNGCPVGSSCDTNAFDTYVLGTYSSGFIAQSENVVTELGSDGTIASGHQSDLQYQVTDATNGSYVGINAGANYGLYSNFIRLVGTTGSNWGLGLLFQYNSITVYSLDSRTGAELVQNDASGATTMKRSVIAGVETWQNAVGTTLATIDQSGSFGAVSYKANGAAGATCPGAMPTSSFASTGGIVTHC